MTARILIIEDDKDIAEGIAENLRLEGYEVRVAATAELGVSEVAAKPPQMILLDLMLPDGSGFDLLHRLRATDVATPVLILSARGAEVDKIRGFRAGADDYLTKPFGVLELMLRIRAILRRTSERATRTERIGELDVRFDSRRVTRGEEELPLSPKEFDLLAALLRRRGQAVSRKELLREVWGYAEGIESRTVDWHIAELRRKIETYPAEPRFLLTVRKVGYRLA